MLFGIRSRNTESVEVKMFKKTNNKLLKEINLRESKYYLANHWHFANQ